MEKTSQEWDHSRIIHLSYRDQVQARLRLLYTQLKLATDILNEIQDSLRELEQLRVEPE